MKAYSIEHVCRDARIALDLNSTSEGLAQLGDVDTLSLDEIIRSKIIESVKHIHATAPVYALDSGYNFGDSGIHWNEDNSGYIILPDDFLRFVCYRMSDWDRTVYGAIGAEDPQYLRQSSRFKGVKGNPQKPVCAITVNPTGKHLEFYSSLDNEATIVQAVYVPYPSIDDEFNTIEICEKCYKAVIYQIAASVAVALNLNTADTYFELAKSSL